MHDYYDPASYFRESYHGNFPSSTRTLYYTRHLLQKAMSVFKFELPERWDENYFLYTLFVKGYICITDVFSSLNGVSLGPIPQNGGITGRNFYYNPSQITIQNPYLRPNSKIVELGVDGEIISLTPDYLGIMDCVNEHAEMMANASAAINLNLYNSRLSYMFWAKNKQQAEAFKKMYDEVGTGQPAVVVDTKLAHTNSKGDQVKPFEPFTTDLKQNYIADQALDDMVKIEQMFARKVGLPSANTTKKERLNVDETNKGDIDTQSNVALWEETINLCIDRVHKLYPDLGLKCERRFKEEVIDGVPLQPAENMAGPRN